MVSGVPRNSSSVSASAARVWTMTGRSAISRDDEVRGEAVALPPSYRRDVAVDLEIVEPGLADPNDPLMARRGSNPVGDCFTSALSGCIARAGPDVRMPFGKSSRARWVSALRRCKETRQHPTPRAAASLASRIVEIVQMAVRVDQHAYMVCVWRSDCSAPAR